MLEFVIVIVVISAVGFWLWRIKSVHSEGMFAAKASGDLYDLGIDVRRLPQDAKAKFFREAHALNTATNGTFLPKNLAMRFFGWYCTEYPKFDPMALNGDGRLLKAIIIMRQWSEKDERLKAAAQNEMAAIFRVINGYLETASGDRGELIAQQIQLAEFARLNGLEKFENSTDPTADSGNLDSLAKSIASFKASAIARDVFSPNIDSDTLSWATGILFYAAMRVARNLDHRDIPSVYWNTLNHRMIIEMLEEHNVDYPERETVEMKAFNALAKVEAMADSERDNEIQSHLGRVFGSESRASFDFLIDAFRSLTEQSRLKLVPDFMKQLS